LAEPPVKIEALGLAVRALGEISCSHDFLQLLKEFDVLAKLRDHADQLVPILFISVSDKNLCTDIYIKIHP
jgi:hypothetical protein